MLLQELAFYYSNFFFDRTVHRELNRRPERPRNFLSTPANPDCPTLEPFFFLRSRVVA